LTFPPIPRILSVDLAELNSDDLQNQNPLKSWIWWYSEACFEEEEEYSDEEMWNALRFYKRRSPVRLVGGGCEEDDLAQPMSSLPELITS
jgi:hypothetical protein